MSHKKFGPDRFSRFDVYWIQTNKQTNRQAKFIYRSSNLCLLVCLFVYLIINHETHKHLLHISIGKLDRTTGMFFSFQVNLGSQAIYWRNIIRLSFSLFLHFKKFQIKCTNGYAIKYPVCITVDTEYRIQNTEYRMHPVCLKDSNRNFH